MAKAALKKVTTYLEAGQVRQLKKLSAAQKVPVAALVRQGVQQNKDRPYYRRGFMPAAG